MKHRPVPATAIEPPAQKSSYPPPFAASVEGRLKRRLGDHFGLTNFGINHTTLAPGAISALLHHHEKQDEFIYVLEGTPTLIYGEDEFLLQPGDCMGFRAGAGIASQLVNRSDQPVIYIEVGDRTPGDKVEYPHDDLKAEQLPGGQWQFTRKNGDRYPA